ncbi:hypothetical protein [Bacillus sp. NPDC094106]|uniref:hypothetical protein n=1 Tax=Bacillus sp. NPDC094106 TaxID=3363949 RepID=UPI00380D2CF6
MQKWKLVYQLVVMVIVVIVGIINYSSPLGDWAWFTACIGAFLILQTLTKKHMRE